MHSEPSWNDAYIYRFINDGYIRFEIDVDIEPIDDYTFEGYLVWLDYIAIIIEMKKTIERLSHVDRSCDMYRCFCGCRRNM